MNRLSVALSCLAFAVLGCNSGSGNPTLTSLTSVASDAKCPSGGVTLTAGPDKNGNGKLDADEVNQTQEVCNGTNGQPGMNGMNGMDGMNGTSGDGGAGTNGATSLVKTTALPGGDTHCPMGGTELDFGLDNGAGGGTANDGILQTGEVLSTSYVCNGSLPYYPEDLTAPAAPAGQFTLDSSGGDGVNGSGGIGAQITVDLSPGSLGGGVMIFSTGEADAGFTVPTPPAFVAGANPLTVSSDTTLNGYATLADGLASNDPYFRVDADGYAYQNVNDAGVEVTSLTVAAGKKLSLPLDTNQQYINLGFRNDIHVAGTIEIGVAADGVSGPSVSLSGSNFYIDVGASIVDRGLDGLVSTDGGTNGPVGNGGPLSLQAGALMIQQGSVDTRGGNGATGGQGGQLSLSGKVVYNTGALTSFGGTGAVGGGGLGGAIGLNSTFGTYNSHQLDAYGGAGVTAGGNSQGISMYVNLTGPLKNGGALNSYGGSCTGVDCPGGTAGDVQLTGRGGDVVNGAAIQAYGGDGVGYGGAGCPQLTIAANEGSPGTESNVHLAAGSVRVSGNLNTKGGKGSPGGNGGPITIVANPYNVPQGQSVKLFGYLSGTASGGVGDNASGGSSGYINVYTNTSFPPFGESNSGAASGPVVNYAKLSARGGDGSFGGQPGNISIFTQLQYDFGQPAEVALNFGDLDVTSGSSSVGGAAYYGGNLQVEGVAGAENHGSLKALGGSTSGGPSGASGGGQITVAGDSGPAKNTGAVDASGGGGSGNGGAGGYVNFYATVFDNSGAITAKGGNGSFAGGSGGEIDVLSSKGTSTNSGTFSVAGGNGTPPGAKGFVYVDGIDVTP